LPATLACPTPKWALIVLKADPFEAEAALVSGSSDESREAREERVQQRWETLKRKTGLKPRVLEDFRHEEWTGTGAQTPQ